MSSKSPIKWKQSKNKFQGIFDRNAKTRTRNVYALQLILQRVRSKDTEGNGKRQCVDSNMTTAHRTATTDKLECYTCYCTYRGEQIQSIYTNSLDE